MESILITFLAGTHAEARFAGFPNWQASGFDLDAVVRQWLNRLPGADLDLLHAEAQRLVDAEWSRIERVARALMTAKRLEAAEVVATAGQAA